MGFLSGLTNILTGGNSSKSADASAKALEQFKNLETPDIEGMRIRLEELIEQGQISPEEAEVYLQSQSEMSGISLDPRFKNAQLDALSSLQNISDSGGITAVDRAQLNNIQSEEDTRARGSREAILQNAQARGISGSGIELLSQMQNQQDGAGRASRRGFDVAANAQGRALQALTDAGRLGGQLESNQFGQQAQIAGANDAIKKFNTSNLQNQSNLGVANRNEAQKANLAERQRVADNNVKTRNTETAANAQLAQQDFENKYKKAAGAGGAYNNQAQNFNTAGGQIMGLIGAGIGAAGAAAASDVNVKKNIEKFDASEFLDNLTSYKYNYKNPKEDGEGQQVGVMAQDLEKGAPQMVTDTPNGKVVDYNKAGGPLFASLSHLHDRLRKLEES